MLATARVRGSLLCSRQFKASLVRAYSSPAWNDPVPANNPTPRAKIQNMSDTNAVPTSSMGAHDHALTEQPQDAERAMTMQASNRGRPWAMSQQERSKAMSGPRFEQIIIKDQPSPHAAIELIHKQPVRWVKERVVSCDGGGGPLGHPRIFINVDKPQIVPCGYCGLPFAHHHHKAYLESLPNPSYPLMPQGDNAEVADSQRITDEGFGQR